MTMGIHDHLCEIFALLHQIIIIIISAKNNWFVAFIVHQNFELVEKWKSWHFFSSLCCQKIEKGIWIITGKHHSFSSSSYGWYPFCGFILFKGNHRASSLTRATSKFWIKKGKEKQCGQCGKKVWSFKVKGSHMCGCFVWDNNSKDLAMHLGPPSINKDPMKVH
jgi:hypothetical protein